MLYPLIPHCPGGRVIFIGSTLTKNSSVGPHAALYAAGVGEQTAAIKTHAGLLSFFGQKIVGKFVQASVVGVPPLLMGVGPAAAIPVVLEKTGLNKDEVDIYEINEAFASQCLYCINELGLDINKVNPKGGAIAFGHPLGVTGARQVSTLLTELKRTGKKVGVTSMCVGTG